MYAAYRLLEYGDQLFKIIELHDYFVKGNSNYVSCIIISFFRSVSPLLLGHLKIAITYIHVYGYKVGYIL